MSFLTRQCQPLLQRLPRYMKRYLGCMHGMPCWLVLVHTVSGLNCYMVWGTYRLAVCQTIITWHADIVSRCYCCRIQYQYCKPLLYETMHEFQATLFLMKWTLVMLKKLSQEQHRRDAGKDGVVTSCDEKSAPGCPIFGKCY